jgi:ribulose-phosphate 3-epimerase
MRVQVAPSLLAADPGRLAEAALQAQEAGADMLHLDVMDGRFVPSITFGPGLVASLSRNCGIPLDVHLMIEEPERHLEAFAAAGSHIITLHVETSPHIHRLLGQIKGMGIKAGVSLNPGTPLSAVRWVLDVADMVLVMTVNPGAGGQAFIDSMTRKIARLRAIIDGMGLGTVIEVDGGITPRTAPAAIDAGATVLVAGSAVFGQEDMAGAIRAIRGGS